MGVKVVPALVARVWIGSGSTWIKQITIAIYIDIVGGSVLPGPNGTGQMDSDKKTNKTEYIEEQDCSDIY